MLGKERKHPAAPLLDVSCAELSDTFELHRERAGIAKDTPMGTVTLHSLRHTYITLLDAAGATHAQREALARHQESARITARYTHVADAELRRVVEGLWRIVEEAVRAADKPKEAQA
jgi:integrase